MQFKREDGQGRANEMMWNERVAPKGGHYRCAI